LAFRSRAAASRAVSGNSMGASFSDITLYAGAHKVGTPEYLTEVSLINFVCDWYVRQMNGYKPPKVTRVSISPSFHGIWTKPTLFGSVLNVAPKFDNKYFQTLDKSAQYKYVLEVVHEAMLLGTKEFGWDKSVFDLAYQKVLESGFQFRLTYPTKISPDKKKSAGFVVEKTDTLTSAFIELENGGKQTKVNLFDKRNSWFYDCVYLLGKSSKWFDSDRFGFPHKKTNLAGWYSIESGEVSLYEKNTKVDSFDFSKHFLFQ
jgi:hypothetical protein